MKDCTNVYTYMANIVTIYCIYTCICIHIHMHVCVYICVYVCVYVYICICMCVYALCVCGIEKIKSMGNK